MDDLLAQFLIEAPELAQQAGDDLMALERDPGDRPRLDSAFRAIHTLKGSVGLFDLEPMGACLHAAEDLLGAIRAGGMQADRSTLDALLAVVSQVERWLSQLERAGVLDSEAATVAGGLVDELAALTGAAPTPAAQPPAADTTWADALVRANPGLGAKTLTAVRYVPDPQSYFSGDDPVAIVRAAPGVVAVRVGLREPPAADYDPFVCNLVFELLCEAALEPVKAAFRFVADQVVCVAISGTATALTPAPAEGAVARTLRVDASRIDLLADLVDQLVVAKNGLASGTGDSLAAIERVTAALHRNVTALRLTPFAPVLRRLPRLVRDSAASLGKVVDLIIEDTGVEADRAVVDGVYEPLLHILRNAVDHGVEPAGARVAAGKSERAVIRLMVRRAGDQVVIEVVDDGRGVDPDAVRRVALARGLRSAEQLAALTDEEAVELVFAPGFSTAQTVTDLSGRGVGMDAVRVAVARLGGRAVLSSHRGQGTTVTLTLPFSTVLAKVMVVAAGAERFGVPMDGVLETVQLAREQIVPVRHGEAFVLRDRVTPLFRLAALLGDGAAVDPQDRLKVLVVSDGGEPMGVAVDAILERLDVVLRPMTGLLSGSPGIMGTALMGDGGVLMILDLPELVG